MELKRVNVTIPENAYDILDRYQKRRELRSKDKALAEFLLEFGPIADGKTDAGHV